VLASIGSMHCGTSFHGLFVGS